MGRHIEVTFKEERILQALQQKIRKGYGDPVGAAADELRLARHTIYTTLHRIRNRYRRALSFGREYRSWRKKLGDEYL